MDDLTRERFGVIPYEERYARPNPPPKPNRPRASAETVARRRIDLCGTDDLEVGDKGNAKALAAHRRLIDVIRRWRA